MFFNYLNYNTPGYHLNKRIVKVVIQKKIGNEEWNVSTVIVLILISLDMQT